MLNFFLRYSGIQNQHHRQKSTPGHSKSGENGRSADQILFCTSDRQIKLFKTIINVNYTNDTHPE